MSEVDAAQWLAIVAVFMFSVIPTRCDWRELVRIRKRRATQLRDQADSAMFAEYDDVALQYYDEARQIMESIEP